MQKTYNRQSIMQTAHTTFGGIIYPSDFNTESRGKPRVNGSLTANRIAQDFRFDEECKKYPKAEPYRLSRLRTYERRMF